MQLLYLLQLWYLSYLLHVVAFVEFVHWRLGLSFMLSCCIQRLSQFNFGRSPSQLRNSNLVPAFPNNFKSHTEQQFLHNVWWYLMLLWYVCFFSGSPAAAWHRIQFHTCLTFWPSWHSNKPTWWKVYKQYNLLHCHKTHNFRCEWCSLLSQPNLQFWQDLLMLPSTRKLFAFKFSHLVLLCYNCYIELLFQYHFNSKQFNATDFHWCQ